MGTDVAKASLELYSSCFSLPNARVTGMGRHGQLRLVFKLTLFTDVSRGSMGKLWAGQSFGDEKQEQNHKEDRAWVLRAQSWQPKGLVSYAFPLQCLF